MAFHGLREKSPVEISATASKPITRKAKTESKGSFPRIRRYKLGPSKLSQGDQDQIEPEPVSKSALSPTNIASVTRTNGDSTGESGETDVLVGDSQVEAELAKWRKQSEAIIRHDEDVQSNDYWRDDSIAGPGTFRIRKHFIRQDRDI